MDIQTWENYPKEIRDKLCKNYRNGTTIESKIGSITAIKVDSEEEFQALLTFFSGVINKLCVHDVKMCKTGTIYAREAETFVELYDACGIIGFIDEEISSLGKTLDRIKEEAGAIRMAAAEVQDD